MKRKDNLFFVYSMITLGAVLYGIATTLFVFPHKLLLGGTTGISVILTYALPFSPATILQIINAALLILAFIFLGKSMGVRTLVGSLLTSGSIYLFELVFDRLLDGPLISNMLLSAVCGAAIIAVATGIMFYVRSSSGGTDIVALIVNKYSKIKVGLALLLSDVVIVIAGGIISGYELGIVSFVGLVVKTTGIDLVIALIIKYIKRKSRTASLET